MTGNPRGSKRKPLEGLYGDLYKVRRLNHFLPQLYGSRVTSEADQSNSLAAYARFHKAVPLRRIDGVQIECLSESSWGDPYLHRRLSSERTRFQVLIWPFQVVEYPGFDVLEQTPPPQFIHLYEVRDEDDLREQVCEALTKARDLKVTFLLFPELTISPETEKHIRETLRGHGIDGYPILTLFGRCHQRNAAGTLDLNEAVLLGPDGTELHRHRKVAVYTGYSQDRTSYFGEQLEAGDKVSVLECGLGNLTPLICLDFLHVPLSTGPLRASHGNLFPVPSLSPKTSGHLTAAKILQASNYACMFVCNRWRGKPAEEATSFLQLPRKEGSKAHLPNPGNVPYLLFSVEQELDNQV